MGGSSLSLSDASALLVRGLFGLFAIRYSLFAIRVEGRGVPTVLCALRYVHTVYMYGDRPRNIYSTRDYCKALCREEIPYVGPFHSSPLVPCSRTVPHGWFHGRGPGSSVACHDAARRSRAEGKQSVGERYRRKMVTRHASARSIVDRERDSR